MIMVKITATMLDHVPLIVIFFNCIAVSYPHDESQLGSDIVQSSIQFLDVQNTSIAVSELLDEGTLSNNTLASIQQDNGTLSLMAGYRER